MQRERTASIQALTMRFDMSTVELHQALDQCQADPETTARAQTLRARAGEHIKHPGKQLGRDTDAAVADADLDSLALLPGQCQVDLASWIGVRRAVVDEDRQDLYQACQVAVEHERCVPA